MKHRHVIWITILAAILVATLGVRPAESLEDRKAADAKLSKRYKVSWHPPPQLHLGAIRGASVSPVVLFGSIFIGLLIMKSVKTH